MLLDELFITLSLNPAKFVQGIKQSQGSLQKFREDIKKSADEAERDAQKMGDGFARVTKELLGLGLAIAGANGLKNLVVGTVQAADALNLQSRALDVNAQALNKWVNTARRAGVDAGTAQGAFGGMVRTLGGVLTRQVTPQQAGLPALQALGVTNPDWANWEHFAQQVVEGLQRHQEAFPGQRASLAAAIPGGDVLLQIANQFRNAGDLNRALDESATATREQADAARRLTEQFTQLQLAIEKAINKLIPEAEPTVTKVLKAVTSATKGDYSGLQALDEDLGRKSLEGQQEVKNALWDAFVRAVVKPERQSRYLSGSDFIGPREAAGPYQPEMIPETRNLPPQGARKLGERFPGLGPAAFASGTYQGWPGAGNAPVDMSRTIRIDQVTLTLPPGTRDPQAFADRFTSAVSAIEAQQGPR
jgi:hypothetical protein